MAMHAPDDYQQGATVKIMFLHVPSAWLGMFGWGVMSIAALGTLVWRHPLADVAGKAAAPIGAAFTFLCLVTGSLWGRPMWGTYWVWDARLTSVLSAVPACISACIALVGARPKTPSRRARRRDPDAGRRHQLPIIKFSVDWWNTLHQPASVLRLGGSSDRSVDPVPLLVMALAFTLLFFTLHLAAMRNEILRRRVRAHADDAGAGPREPRHESRTARRFHRRRLCGRRSSWSALLIAWVVLDYSAQRRALGELEERGVTRRSTRKRA